MLRGFTNPDAINGRSEGEVAKLSLPQLPKNIPEPVAGRNRASSLLS